MFVDIHYSTEDPVDLRQKAPEATPEVRSYGSETGVAPMRVAISKASEASNIP